MRQLTLDNTLAVKSALICGLMPSGRIDVQLGSPSKGPVLPAAVQQRILEAFTEGRGNGVLYLGTAMLNTDLHPSLSYWRDIGRHFVSNICGALDPMDPKSVVIPDPSPEEITVFLQDVPPMLGAELITSTMLEELWVDMGKALSCQADQFADGIQGYLKKHNSVWNVVGRVCFHLAENKRDPEFPFAFIATYVHKLSKQARPQHRPLGQALKEYAGANNRQKLLTLLSPLSRASEQSELIRKMLEVGDIYHPLSWTPREAYHFLCEVALYERAGLIVRLPDWWKANSRPRPMVSVTVGGKTPSKLGMEALLDFDIALTIDGQSLSQAEIDMLLASSQGLVLIKGKWIEVDPSKLSEVLGHWMEVQRRVANTGVSFGEAMRMLAGARIDSSGEQDSADENQPEWSAVIAGNWLAERLDALRSAQLRSAIHSNAGLRTKLRPYQKLGIQWLWTLRTLELGGLLADDMGLGKTVQVLAVLSLSQRNRETGTDLLVVPASILDNWRLEIERFIPQLKVLIVHPSRMPSTDLKNQSNSTIVNFDAVITTYNTALRTDWMKTHPWRTIILDEAQAIKNPSAKQTKAIKTMRSTWRLALTGTPVENRLGDLWSIFDFLNPGLLGSAKAFDHFCKSMARGKSDSNSSGGYAPLRRLVQPYILRRLKTDKSIIADLPDKSEVNAYCLLSKHQAALYQQSVDEMKRVIVGLKGMKRRGAVLAFLMRFKQICNHPSHLSGDGGYEPEQSGKFARLRELCESIAARQDKVLVFTQFREITEPLSGYLTEIFGRSGVVLHGGTPVKKRTELVTGFQEDERVPYMVLSLKVGGTGLNLTAASHVIHFDRWWNPAVENQATDRAYRIGQRKNVLVHKFLCRGTVEERIDELIADKRNLSEEILSGGAESVITEMNNQQLISMVSLDLGSALVG